MVKEVNSKEEIWIYYLEVLLRFDLVIKLLGYLVIILEIK